MMLPPPSTTAVSTPRSWTSRISSASRATKSGAMPNFCSPISASPESFRRMRRYAGDVIEPGLCRRLRPHANWTRAASGGFLGAPAQTFAELEADEAQVQRPLAGALGDDLSDGLLGVLDEGLLDQHGLLVELLDFSVGD